MHNKLFETDLSHLDHHALEKISRIAEQAKGSLMIGIASIRNLEDEATSQPAQPRDADQMVEQLSRLTLMWDEIQHRATQLLADPLTNEQSWTAINRTPPSTLH